MKKWVILLLAAVLWSCQILDDDDFIPSENQNFNMVVPEKFSWSAVLQDVLLVNILSDSIKSYALDSTIIQLYNENNELLDALTIFRGQACFNFRIATSACAFKIKIPATNSEIEISSKVRCFNFDVSNVSVLPFKRKDSDKDGLFDKFDEAPNDPHLTANLKHSNTGTFYIFDDSWPLKGDFDFNDFVVNTIISWKRGKNNFIEEISGICNAEWKSTGFGLGFELFEQKGNNLIYNSDIISETKSAATQSASVNNGLIVIDKTLSAGKTTREFVVKLKENCLTDLVFVPYLFKTENENYQVRPFGTPPTQIQLMELFHSGDDASPNSWEWSKGRKFKYPLTGSNAFYRTSENYPWGIEFMANTFKPSNERQSIEASFPGFKNWVESGGQLNKNWYNFPLN